jgi:hypothetical protein
MHCSKEAHSFDRAAGDYAEVGDLHAAMAAGQTSPSYFAPMRHIRASA